jgi:hypothetical protein
VSYVAYIRHYCQNSQIYEATKGRGACSYSKENDSGKFHRKRLMGEPVSR